MVLVPWAKSVEGNRKRRKATVTAEVPLKDRIAGEILLLIVDILIVYLLSPFRKMSGRKRVDFETYFFSEE
jgi:hypothetical protein